MTLAAFALALASTVNAQGTMVTADQGDAYTFTVRAVVSFTVVSSGNGFRVVYRGVGNDVRDLRDATDFLAFVLV